MKNQRLRNIVLIYISLGVAYLALGLVLFKWYNGPLNDSDLANGVKESSYFELYKELTTVVVAIPTSYLAYAFQRRTSYLEALRNLWKDLIPAVQRAIQYTHLSVPDYKEFSDVQKELSTMVDALRGVSKNVPMQGNELGLYPYEPLKDIQKIIAWVHNNGNGRPYHENRAARRIICKNWHCMHSAMLLEFDREVPVKPVSRYLQKKPDPIQQVVAELNKNVGAGPV